MNLNPAELLNPIFNGLDSLIENDGVYLHLVFVWLVLLAISWIFRGGLRKRMNGNSATVIPAVIVTMQLPTELCCHQSAASRLIRHGTATANDELAMTTFHLHQPDCARRVHKKAIAGTFNITSQIAPSICTVAFTKCEKSDATIFRSRCSRTVVCYRFDREEARPLSRAKVFRLANGSPKLVRSPARRSCDGRESSGKKSGEMSHVISAQRPGNSRTFATAMPPNVRQDNSQGNLPCAGFGRAMSAPETCETTRNLAAQQPRNISQAARGNFAVSF
jgi:hypothetical protein